MESGEWSGPQDGSVLQDIAESEVQEEEERSPTSIM